MPDKIQYTRLNLWWGRDKRLMERFCQLERITQRRLQDGLRRRRVGETPAHSAIARDGIVGGRRDVRPLDPKFNQKAQEKFRGAIQRRDGLDGTAAVETVHAHSQHPLVVTPSLWQEVIQIARKQVRMHPLTKRRGQPIAAPALARQVIVPLTFPRGVRERKSHEEEEVVLQHGQFQAWLVAVGRVASVAGRHLVAEIISHPGAHRAVRTLFQGSGRSKVSESAVMLSLWRMPLPVRLFEMRFQFQLVLRRPGQQAE
mmetsp:Transcript_29233/g.60909  ORF Transcript_29233/g.60909 Transcript_29233/m.60909 type:complete len:257 (-) Transcript_29233:1351-2121(-)